MYSSNKPYQRSTYRTGTDPNYDRLLKEGKAITEKESVLEKPYKAKNYNSMQQDYNPIPLPPLDPGYGTGGFKCVYVEDGCDQLVGCWAGSDIKLDGDDAETAGYVLPINVTEGEIVKTVIGGGEDRGITLYLNPLVARNTFEVTFKAGNGELFTEKIDIACSTLPTYYVDYLPASYAGNRAVAVSDSSGYLHIFADGYVDPTRAITYIVWTNLGYTDSLLSDAALLTSACIDSSDNIYVAYFLYSSGAEQVIKVATYNGSIWSYETIKDFGASVITTEAPNIQLDSSGYLHIIVQVQPVSGSPYDKYIYHYTNSSGSWQEEILTAALHGTVRLNYYIDGTTIHLAFWHREVNVSYLEYMSGSWGSWSATTTVKSGVSYYDNLSIVKTSDGNKHIITAYNIYCYEYIYTSSWSEQLIYSSTIENRSPHAIAVGNLVYACLLVASGFDYYPVVFEKDTSWNTRSTELGGDQTSMAPFILYDDVSSLLHIIQSNVHSYTSL
jgi:hypothetical protein